MMKWGSPSHSFMIVWSTWMESLTTALLLLFLGQAVTAMVLGVDDEALRVHVAGEVVIAQGMFSHSMVDVQRADWLVDVVPGPQEEPVSILHLKIAFDHGGNLAFQYRSLLETI